MARTQGTPAVENFCPLSESYQSDLLPKKYYRTEEADLLLYRLPPAERGRLPKNPPLASALFPFQTSPTPIKRDAITKRKNEIGGTIL